MIELPFQPGIVKPEADYLELERLGKKLGIPVPMMYIELQAKNPDGSLGDHYKDRSRTYNRNFWNLIFGELTSAPAGTATFGAGFLALKSTGAVVAGIPWNSTSNNTHAGITMQGLVGNAAYGIIAGTGITAESFENTTLVTPIAQGTGAGQMSYAAMTAGTPAYNAGTKTWTNTLVRILNNNSGGSIVVGETGIYLTMQEAATPVQFMIERSLLGATVSVLNAGQLTITYTITLTFPA